MLHLKDFSCEKTKAFPIILIHKKSQRYCTRIIFKFYGIALSGLIKITEENTIISVLFVVAINFSILIV